MEAVLTKIGYYIVITDPKNINSKKRAKALAFIRLSYADSLLL
jgi:hypothetical protein